MATAFTGTLVWVAQDGYRWTDYVTMTDINAAFYIFPDGQAFKNLPNNHGILYLADVIISAAGGASVRTAAIWANGRNTGEILHHASNYATNTVRQYSGRPLKFRPGTRVAFVQTT